MRLGADLKLGREVVPHRIGDRIFTLTQDGSRNRLSFLRDD